MSKTTKKVETKKAETKKEEPKKVEKKVEAKKEEPKKVETKKEAPKKEAPKKEEKKVEAPKKEEPKVEVKKEDLKKEVVKPKRKGEKSKKKVVKRFGIDCSVPVRDGILDLDDFHNFLLAKWKIDGKVGLVGKASVKIPKVAIVKEHEAIRVTSEAPVVKKYLKYLTKKYLKKHELINWLHIVGVDKTTYNLKYIPIAQEEQEGAEEKVEETK